MRVLSNAQFEKAITHATKVAAAREIQDLVVSERPQDLRFKFRWSLSGRHPFWFEGP